MINLLSNALKFTPEGGEVSVIVTSGRGAQLHTPTVQIAISDTGIGIPADRLDKIFDRFYQVQGARKMEEEGTGIGLALAKELVQLHNGNIRVESEENQGTVFRVILPLGKKHLQANQIIEEPTPLSPPLVRGEEKSEVDSTGQVAPKELEVEAIQPFESLKPSQGLEEGFDDRQARSPVLARARRRRPSPRLGSPGSRRRLTGNRGASRGRFGRNANARERRRAAIAGRPWP